MQALDIRDPEIFTVALHTLGSFDFSGHELNEFIRECVVMYLDDENAEIRKAAALTCAQVLIKTPGNSKELEPIHSSHLLSETLEKLLTVGIADPDPTIRHALLSALDERFDPYLSHPENIRALFISLHDEIFAIREVSMLIIGRVAERNPAYVLPALRRTLIQLLTELEYSVVRFFIH